MWDEIRTALVPVEVNTPAMYTWLSRVGTPECTVFVLNTGSKVWFPWIHGRCPLQEKLARFGSGGSRLRAADREKKGKSSGSADLVVTSGGQHKPGFEGNIACSNIDGTFFEAADMGYLHLDPEKASPWD